MPPILFNLLKSKNNFANSILWKGNYKNWTEANDNSIGYNAENILNLCKASLLKVKNGEAIYERDSVIFDKKQYSWPLLAALQKIASTNNGQLNIIDFGGSLGSSYYQNKDFLSHLKKIKWSIVEQQHFVVCGKQYFEDESINYFEDIETCRLTKKSNTILLSGVLQYLEHPYEWINKVLEFNFDYIIIDRTTFINDKQRLTVQNVPDWIYKASYPCWFFNEQEFLSKFKDQYEIIADFDSYADEKQLSEDGKQMYWKGYFLKRK